MAALNKRGMMLATNFAGPGSTEWLALPGGEQILSILGTFAGNSVMLQLRDTGFPSEVITLSGDPFATSDARFVILSDMHEGRLSIVGAGASVISATLRPAG